MVLMRTAPRPTATPLGAYIQAKRIEAELSQDALAQRVGTSQGGVSNWEAGGVVPSAKAIAALARALPGATADEMLDLAEMS
jgi:transcriptional regulator with XRE-family HTH domain